ncbi:DUF397 domain-containing protein [Streptomyces monashensis]|uniref:DUF397 domain-containing protein n=1 Tax=Streptomyces monashensis TaxID=1678012 RepID=UPI0033E9FCEE
MSELAWQKSTYSGDASNCLEISTPASASTTLHIRDSKTPTTPHLTVTPATWTEFLGWLTQ